MLGNMKVVQAFGYQKEAEERFHKINNKLAGYSLRATFFSSITNPATRFVNSLVYAAVGITGAYAVIRGFMTVGQLTSFLSYANQYTKPFNEISGVVTELQNARDPGEELGDLLFSCVNVARLSGIDPEQALKNATEKFIKRFSAMENLIKLDEKSLRDLTLSEMDVYWNRVKAAQNRAVEPSSPADWKR